MKGKETAMKSSTAGRQHEAPQEPPYPSQDWTQIDAKTTVEVRYPSGYSYKAIVDEKSPDSRIVWVLSIDGLGRKMYGNWEGVQLRNGAAGSHARPRGCELMAPFARGEHSPELVNTPEYLTSARPRTAEIDAAEMKLSNRLRR
jgi:hypothetical protein